MIIMICDAAMARWTVAFMTAVLVVCVVVIGAQGRNIDQSPEEASSGTDLQDPKQQGSNDGDGPCVAENSVNGEFGCCGRQKYNKASHLCCDPDSVDSGPQLVESIYGQHSFCCRLGVFNDVVDGCCDGLPFNLAGQLCCDGTAIRGRMYGEKTACCGPTVYNVDDQVCCAADTLRRRVFGAATDCCVADGQRQCCEDPVTGTASPYDPATQLCCGGTTKDRVTSNSTCCGDAVYDVDAHVCCADESVGTACCGSTAVGGPGTEQRACCGGNKAYDATTEVCCDEVVRRRVFDGATACCGTAVYDSTAGTCCDGAVKCVDVETEELQC